MIDQKLLRISDVAPYESDDLPVVRWVDIVDTNYILKSFTFREGDYGEYVSMELTSLDGGEHFVTNCGGDIVLRQLRAVTPELDLPLLIMFQTEGRRVFLL